MIFAIKNKKRRSSNSEKNSNKMRLFFFKTLGVISKLISSSLIGNKEGRMKKWEKRDRKKQTRQKFEN